MSPPTDTPRIDTPDRRPGGKRVHRAPLPHAVKAAAEAPEELLAEDIDSTVVAVPGDAKRPRSHHRRRAIHPLDLWGQTVAARPTRARIARIAPGPIGAVRVKRSLRSVASLAMVGGLIATAALPAYGAWRTSAGVVAFQHGGVVEAQALPVGDEAAALETARDSYTAVSATEIARKAEEAAAQARMSANIAFSTPANLTLVSPGTGEVRWPILTFTLGRGLWANGYHQGVDLLAPAMTPIYATAAGVVSVSSEGYNGYGVTVAINHTIGGKQVNSLYGHMTYGTRQVAVGQTVAAGQLIGYVGSTGSSTANHLHFEVHINGTVVDPWAWLKANAG